MKLDWNTHTYTHTHNRKSDKGIAETESNPVLVCPCQPGATHHVPVLISASMTSGQDPWVQIVHSRFTLARRGPPV